MSWKLIRESAALYKDAASTIGLLLSAISLGSAVKSLLSLNMPLFDAIVQAYLSVIRAPILSIARFMHLEISPLLGDILVLYLVFGCTTIRALSKIYNPDRVWVVKGTWGWLSSWVFAVKSRRGRRLGKHAYLTLGVLLWPTILVEYSLRYRNVWNRYLDHCGKPDLDACIMKITSNAATVKELIPGSRVAGYNEIFDYEFSSDTWYALRGSFPVIFLMGLGFTVVAFMALVTLAYLAAL